MWIGKQNKAFKFDCYAGQFGDVSGYESALGIWFVVEKINRWFSQQGFSWHWWTCWLFLCNQWIFGYAYSSLGDKVATHGGLPPLALMCGWLWHGRCMCRDMSHSPCCTSSVAAAPLLPPKPAGPWLGPCLLVVQPCPACAAAIPCDPAMLMELLLCPCGSRGRVRRRRVSASASGTLCCPKGCGSGVCFWAQPLGFVPSLF